jgi:ribosomal protein L39E
LYFSYFTKSLTTFGNWYNQIVCGCFNLKQNPQAPYIIVVGTGNQIIAKAQLLRNQNKPIPVFVKKRAKHWEYKGDFFFQRYSKDPDEIKCLKIRSAKRMNITEVIYLGK